VLLLLASLTLVSFVPPGIPGEFAMSPARSDRDCVAPFLPGALAVFPEVRSAAKLLAGRTRVVIARSASSSTPLCDVPGGLPVRDEQARWCLLHSTNSSIP
jgi:hypothetical protein